MNATQRRGGFSLGIVLALIGAVHGATTGWAGSAIALLVGGAIIAAVHSVFLVIAHRRK